METKGLQVNSVLKEISRYLILPLKIMIIRIIVHTKGKHFAFVT